MSFIKKRIFVKEGWLADHPPEEKGDEEEEKPHKRLSSISQISIEPATKKQKTTAPSLLVNPFEKYYDSPLLKMAKKDEAEEEEEEEESKTESKKEENKAKIKSYAELKEEIPKDLKNAFVQPFVDAYHGAKVAIPALYNDFVVRPGQQLNALLGSNGKEEHYLKILQDRDRQIVERRKLFEEDDGDDYSDDEYPTGFFEEEERKYEEAEKARQDEKRKAQQETAGLLMGNLVQKGYKERMDATLAVQGLLRGKLGPRKHEEDKKELNKAVSELQGLFTTNRRQKKLKEQLGDENGEVSWKELDEAAQSLKKQGYSYPFYHTPDYDMWNKEFVIPELSKQREQLKIERDEDRGLKEELEEAKTEKKRILDRIQRNEREREIFGERYYKTRKARFDRDLNTVDRRIRKTQIALQKRHAGTFRKGLLALQEWYMGDGEEDNGDDDDYL